MSFTSTDHKLLICATTTSPILTGEKPEEAKALGHVPAVHDDRPGVWNASLCSVHLVQKAENPPWLIGHAVVWPAEVLVMLDQAGMFMLQGGEPRPVVRMHCMLQAHTEGTWAPFSNFSVWMVLYGTYLSSSPPQIPQSVWKPTFYSDGKQTSSFLCCTAPILLSFPWSPHSHVSSAVHNFPFCTYILTGTPCPTTHAAS